MASGRKPHPFLRLPNGMSAAPISSAAGCGKLLCLDHAVLKAGKTPPLAIGSLKNWLALRLEGLYWMVPQVGDSLVPVPKNTQFLLWEHKDGSYGILLGLVEGDLRAWIDGEKGGLSLRWDGALKGKLPEHAALGYVNSGSDPHELVAQAMHELSQYMGTFRLREEKPNAPFADLLGWCTWDAFYHEVDEPKMLAGLRSFKKGGVQPGFVMLDDGWEERDKDLLNSFEAKGEKFPSGLKAFVEKAKREFGVQLFGIHHPFQGYWAGVNPKSTLGHAYRLVANRGCIRPWEGPAKDKLFLVHPLDVHRFFQDFYARLRQQGIDMVKVDGMSAHHLFTENKLGRVGTMRAWQQAQQGAAAFYFQSQTIPCMSNGSDVLYHLGASNGWRNSTDYFPGRPVPVQQNHVYINAMNNVWSSTFALPDWDMFQSHQPEAWFHAAARAVSGGPVYVCDKPGKQDFAVLAALSIRGGKLLRCDRPAQVTRDCLFVDTHHTPQLLKVSNVNGATPVLGVFHVTSTAGPIAGSYCAADIPEADLALRYCAYAFRSGQVQPVGARNKIKLTLDPMGWEVITFAPVCDDVAVIGLLDKLNGSGAIASCLPRKEGGIAIEMVDGGRLGCWCAQPPKLVMVQGKKVRTNWNKATGLLQVELPPGQPVRVEIA